MQYSRSLSILIRITILYLLVVSSRVLAFCVSVAARALHCVCFGLSNTRVPMFHLKVHCRKCPMQKQVNWKASRFTSGTAYSCEVRSSVVADQAGNLALSLVAEQGLETWNSRVAGQVEPGNFVFCVDLNQS